MGHEMKQFFRNTRSLLPAAALLMAAPVALAQSGSFTPVPFASVVAGVAPGSGITSCTTGVPNVAGVTTYGDGCPATQGLLTTFYDVQVDAAGDLYVGENAANHDMRVVYNGGAILKNLLIAASPFITNFAPSGQPVSAVPLVGSIYTLAGGESAALTAQGGIYYCGNIKGGIQAIDSMGNGCPAAMTYLTPKGMWISPTGDVYTVNVAGKNSVRVIYAGNNPQLYNLIVTEYAAIKITVTPKAGYIYTVLAGGTTGTEGDGGPALSAGLISPRYVTVDTRGDIYVGDGTTSATVTTAGVTYNIDNSGNNVREVDGITGIITTVAGENNCETQPANAANLAGGYSSTYGCPYAYYSNDVPTSPSPYTTAVPGDGGPATASQLYSPYVIFLDQYNNLYISDHYNGRIRVVYRGGTVAGLVNPVVGYIYTYAGGGTLATNGATAQTVKFSSTLTVGGIDKAGNIYNLDGTTLWKFDAFTGVGTILSNGTSSTGAAPKGTPCNDVAGSPGPVSVDNYADGCPLTQVYLNEIGDVAFDNQNNFYMASNGNAILQKFSFNTQLPSSPDGTAVTQPMAFFTELSTPTLTGYSFALQGATGTDFSDNVTGDTCALNTVLAAKATCIVYAKLNPTHDGLRSGSVTVNTALGAAVTENVTGIGLGSDLAIDPGTRSTLGAGITPNGVATDLLGNVYVADSKGNQVLKGASSGTALTQLISGLSKPSQVAVDDLGNVYVADAGNNRVLETTAAGATVASFTISASVALSGPKGVVVDAFGNIYVADTGNNRIVVFQPNGIGSPLYQITGLSAPTELALDQAGDLFILNSGTSPAQVMEYTGATGLNAITLDAGVNPVGVAVDPAGDIFVEDSAGGNVLVYPGGLAPGNILLSSLTTPVGLAADVDANLFIADTANTGAVELCRVLSTVNFPLTNINPPSTTTESVTLSNVGNAGMTFPAAPMSTITGANAALFSFVPATTNGCGLGITYTPGTGCNFTDSFSPIVAVTATATQVFNTNAVDTATAKALLNGVGKFLIATTSTLTVSSTSGSTIYYSESVTLTATLTPASSAGTPPTGTFTFTIDGRTQPAETLVNGATDTLTLSEPVGSHSVCVTYSGDTNYASSSSCTTFTVNKAVTTTVLTAVPVNNAGSLTLLFTATVTSATAVGETGTITFYAGTVPLATITGALVNGVFTATYNSNALSFASNVLTATYNGNANFAASTSAAVQTNGGDFAVGFDSTTITIPQGGIGLVSVTLESLFGGAGTIVESCTGLPANSVCRFTPDTVTLGTTPVVIQIQVYTNVASTLASNGSQPRSSTARGIVLALGLPLGISLLLLRRRTRLRVLALLLLGVSLATGLSGCSGTKSTQTFSGLITPVGTYPLTFTFTGSNGLTTTHSSSATFVVLQDSGQY